MMSTLPQTLTANLLSSVVMTTAPQAASGGEDGGFAKLIAAQANRTAPRPESSGQEGGFVKLVAAQANQTAPADPAAEVAQTVRVARPSVTTDAPDVSLPASAFPSPSIEAVAPSVQPSPALTLQQEPQVAVNEIEIDADPKAKIDVHRDANAIASALSDAIARFAVPAANAQLTKAPPTAKPGETEIEGDAAPVDGEAALAEAILAPIFGLISTVPATDLRTVKPLTQTVSRDFKADAQLVAPKSRDTATMLSALVAPSVDAPVAKAAAEPSMTVIFAQSAAAPAVTGSAAQPIVISERVLDLGSDGAWIDQLASDIAATKSTSNEVSFRLMPRHLGRLDIAMIAGEGGVSLKMETQHEATATIVHAAQARLVDDLRQQGVRVTDTQVSCTAGETGHQSQGQDRATPDGASHLIETANERAEPRDEDQGAARRGRFA